MSCADHVDVRVHVPCPFSLASHHLRVCDGLERILSHRTPTRNYVSCHGFGLIDQLPSSAGGRLGTQRWMCALYADLRSAKCESAKLCLHWHWYWLVSDHNRARIAHQRRTDRGSRDQPATA